MFSVHREEQVTHDFQEKLTSRETIQKFLPFFRDALLEISDFEPIRVIGEGSFATVHKCRQISTQELVAVKVLKPHMMSSERDVYDFLLEAQLLRKLKHKSIVTFKGICYGQLDTRFGHESICVVTEFMESGTLKDWIRAQESNPDRRIYSQRKALQWMVAIAKGVEYLHRRKFPIIHRDLKPENILLTPQSEQSSAYNAKISDFGLSVMVSSDQRQQSAVTPTSATSAKQALEGMNSDTLPELLKHGRQSAGKSAETLQKALAGASMLIRSDANNTALNRVDSRSVEKEYCLTGKTGSLLYMAPEILRYDMSNEKADVFSFAIVLFEVLQGSRISTRSGTKLTMREAEQFANDVKYGYRLPIPESWPVEIKNLIQQCWNDDPKKRPSMRKVGASLEAMYNSGMFSNNPAKYSKKLNCFFGRFWKKQ